jgi:phospholipase C
MSFRRRKDGWGVGVRVPGIIVSPFAPKGSIDHTEYETVSILKLIERRFNLAPLSARDSDPADKL